MKLLMCLDCGDIFNLTMKEKSCGCGKTKGQYINNLDAEYCGNAQPIGFANGNFDMKYRQQKLEDELLNNLKPKHECCKGVEFTAFFIPKRATSLHKIDE